MMRKKKEKEKEEAEYKNKAGTAWSHSYLNQKPWHPLSYPNQRRKWIAEQTHAQRQRRAEEVAREFTQEQDFFRQASMLSKKEKEKLEAMQAVSFMYMRPPGYNAESARAAELADERKKLGAAASNLSSSDVEVAPASFPADEKRKSRAKDLYGRTVPTEEEFPVLKNAPRLESGALARVKPFAVEIRNVKCARCGAFGHQSGDRECPLKDAIMPNEEARQRRDDPLTTIISHTMPHEPLKWELKQQPGGISPPRGGFKPDDPNQQIIPEDIFDEYGGFLATGDGIPDVLASFSQGKSKKKRHRGGKKLNHCDVSDSGSSECEFSHGKYTRQKHNRERKYKSICQSDSSSSDRKRRQNRKRHKERVKDSKHTKKAGKLMRKEKKSSHIGSSSSTSSSESNSSIS